VPEKKILQNIYKNRLLHFEGVAVLKEFFCNYTLLKQGIFAYIALKVVNSSDQNVYKSCPYRIPVHLKLRPGAILFCILPFS